jgi:2-polyprenyl-3-methyl-5-hydroxy-6-metoxy-1,4-benzoquinol methylase
MKNYIKRLPLIRNLVRRLNNLNERRDLVKEKLSEIKPGSRILDAGCGSQQSREFAEHLDYYAQDFGAYTSPIKKMIGAKETDDDSEVVNYKYGNLDYVGDIWDIKEKDNTFDAILCTEVFEHIPYPIETLQEFSRLLKPGGKLIITAPSNCLRHYDPYFFYTGFSDRWYEKFLKEFSFELNSCEPVGDYYSWLAVEIARTARTHGLIS